MPIRPTLGAILRPTDRAPGPSPGIPGSLGRGKQLESPGIGDDQGGDERACRDIIPT